MIIIIVNVEDKIKILETELLDEEILLQFNDVLEVPE